MNHRFGSRQRPECGRWSLVARLVLGVLAGAALATLLFGVPWGLTVYVGWPLPDHLPTIDDLRGVAFAPMSPYLFLDILACACWLAWAAFVIDVALCLFEAARLRRAPLRARSPLRVPAATLVSLVIVALMSIRAFAAGPGLLVTEVAPAVHTVSAPLIPAAAGLPPIDDTATAGPVEHQFPTSVLVRAPQHGVHDSLWRIAKRTLGEGRRWPEIFELNRGMRQPYGQTFLRPSLIYPGQELRLPVATSPLAPTPERSTTDPTPPSPTPAPDAPPTSAADPTPVVTQPPVAPSVEPPVGGPPEPDNDLVDHLLIGSAVAAAVAGAVVAVRRRNRRRYRPGSGERRDLPVAPVIRRLTAADLDHHIDDLDDPEDERELGSTSDDVPPDDEVESRGRGMAIVDLPDSDARGPGLAPAIGAARGRELALRLAAARGLGLVGEGAQAAMRAILLATVVDVRDGPPAERGLVILVGAVGRRLVGSARNPLTGTVTEPDLDAAAERVEAWLVERVAGGERDAPHGGYPPIVLVVESPPDAEHPRLQSILDNGAQVEVAGLVLGQWRPGITLYVRDDGIVSAASPGPGRQLVGARLFHLDEPAAADIFDLLHDADTPLPGPMLDIDILGSEVEPADAIEKLNHAVADDETVANVDYDDVGACGDVDEGDEHDPPRAVASATNPTSVSVDDADGVDAVPGDEPALHISVMGPPSIHISGVSVASDVDEGEIAEGRGQAWQDVTRSFQRRTRELLVFLAVHPAGVSREALIGAMWPGHSPQQATNSLNTAMSRLRRAVRAASAAAIGDVVVGGEERFRLDPTFVSTDFTAFAAAVAARRRASTEKDREAANRAVVQRYTGPFADGLTSDWIDTVRESFRRDTLDAVTGLARSLSADRPAETLELLETARTLDPHNDAVYASIMRLQARLGLFDAIPRTLALLTTRLAEIDDQPSPEIVRLAGALATRTAPVGIAPATASTHPARSTSNSRSAAG
jgi:DNA-binding SARP family transcriptional activator